ncbi:MAG: iron(III) transport system permease protein, partial [Burkholderiales bacterium]
MELASPTAPAGFRRRIDPAIVVFSVLVLVLAFLVINPLARLVWESIKGADGGATIANYVDAFSRKRHLNALLTTLYLGLSATGLALL